MTLIIVLNDISVLSGSVESSLDDELSINSFTGSFFLFSMVNLLGS